MYPMSYCHGQHLLDRAADGRDYPEPYFTPPTPSAPAAQTAPLWLAVKPVNAFDKLLVPITTKTQEKTQ